MLVVLLFGSVSGSRSRSFSLRELFRLFGCFFRLLGAQGCRFTSADADAMTGLSSSSIRFRRFVKRKIFGKKTKDEIFCGGGWL